MRELIKTYGYRKRKFPFKEEVLLIQFSKQNGKLSRRVIKIDPDGITIKRWATFRKKFENLEEIVGKLIKNVEKDLKDYKKLSEKEVMKYLEFLEADYFKRMVMKTRDLLKRI